MKTIILFLVTVLISMSAIAQDKISPQIFETLPKNMELKNELQKFRVTTTHYNGDIFGNFFNKQQVYGEL